MSSKSELKLPWPEINLHYQAPTVPGPEINLPDLWNQFLSSFQGKQVRFTNYLMYLSTDFSGGFKVCSVLGPNPVENTFSVPVTLPAPSISKEARDQIWERSQKKEWEELNREDWELLGISFLMTGDLTEFHKWISLTSKEFGLTEDCKKYLTLLGWKFDGLSKNISVLDSLVCYAAGDYKNVDFQAIADAILRDGYSQLSGVLLDCIHKNVWTGDQIFPFLNFLTGFYSEWQEWEQAKFLRITLGKVPPFSALKKAKKILKPAAFLEYSKNLKLLFRGEWEESDLEFGFELHVQMDPFMKTLIRFHKEGEDLAKEIMEKLSNFPYSYIINLQYAVVLYRKGDHTGFLKYYENGGRLRYLPLPLYLYARTSYFRKEVSLADSIFQTLEKLNKTPKFPEELGGV